MKCLLLFMLMGKHFILLQTTWPGLRVEQTCSIPRQLKNDSTMVDA